MDIGKSAFPHSVFAGYTNSVSDNTCIFGYSRPRLELCTVYDRLGRVTFIKYCKIVRYSSANISVNLFKH